MSSVGMEEDQEETTQKLKIINYNLACNQLLISSNTYIADILKSKNTCINKNIQINIVKEEFNKQVMLLRAKLIENADDNYIEKTHIIEGGDQCDIIAKENYFYCSTIINNIRLKIISK